MLKKEKLGIIRKFYPNAFTTIDTVNRVIDYDESQLYEATEMIYQAIDKRIQELVALTHFNCRYIIIMGAVLINSDTDIGSFSSARRFDILNVKENTRDDLLSLFSV